jgi:tricorn protease
MPKSAAPLCALLLFVASFAPHARAADTPSAGGALPDGFYRYPAIGAGMIVFASEGDLWKVPVTGGTAMRLTAAEGDERFPKISPDGRWIAFTAQYDGNDDVYVMSADGGEPRRLTYHPLPDVTLGWTSDGKILFRSRRDHPHGDYRVYTIAPTGGVPAMIPLEPAAWIAFEPNGARIAVQKMSLEFHNWKRYKGGQAEQLYVGTLTPLAFRQVTDYDGKNAYPMWAPDGRIYFVTDRWGRPNLASMRPDGDDVRRLTTFSDYDVRWPEMGDGKIVYQHKMDIWCYDLATGENAQVAIRLPSDRLQVRERFVDPMANLGAWALSKDGARIAIETRGDLYVTRTQKKGLVRPVVESSASRTRTPAFSPDGRRIAAWSEVNGEEQLLLFAADNSTPARQLGTVAPGWHFTPAWSPDGAKIAWGDEKQRLYVTDVATGRTSVVDSSQTEIREYVWSPDNRFLAYTTTLDTWYSQVRIRDLAARRSYAVSDPAFDSFSPTWDPAGKYLDFLSARRVNPFLDRTEARFIVDAATVPCVVALQADGELPFAPLGDADATPDTTKSAPHPAWAKKKAAGSGAPIRIDFAGIAERVVEVPVAPGNCWSLHAVEGKLHWLTAPNRGMMPQDPSGDGEDPGADLVTYDIAKQKKSTLASGVKDYDISGNGLVLVYHTKDGFTRVEAGATSAPEGDAAKDAAVDLSGLSVRVNPREEWKQILHEAWRRERDFFYDPRMHGVDWPAVWRQYGPLADRISSRDDVEDLLGEILGELSVGHAYHWGGDLRQGKRVGTGLLGADLRYDAKSGFWQFTKIYRGNFPTDRPAAPLARADLHVAPGLWLVAIDGRPLVKGEDYLARLANRAGREVELSVNTTPSLTGARRIVVKTTPNDQSLRYASWVRETRAYVDSVSHGQIGYIHLYDMGGLGLLEFARDYPSQWNKRGLIFDDRWNHGGFVAPMILAQMDRKLLSVGGTRHSTAVYTTPDRCFHGYMDCLINRQGGSDCETFALGFREFGLGPVIGTRTWGGWIGIRADKTFRDGGTMTEPEYGGWDAAGKTWVIEGHGVDPDVVLDLGPDGFIHGHDLQLDYAIQDLLKKIKADPKNYPPAPPILPRPLVTVK